MARRRETRLRTMATAQDGVFSCADARRVGVDRDDLVRLARQRKIIRLRRSAYVLADVYQRADRDARYRLFVLAVMRSRPRTDRASHHSALALYGIDTYGVPDDTVFVESPVRRSRRKGNAFLHPRCTLPEAGVFQGIHCITPALACVQVAVRFGFEAGLCAMDSAVHKEKCTPAQLTAALVHVATKWRNIVRDVIAAVEPLTESVGETRTRIILLDAGFTIVPQFEVKEGRTLIGRVDFLVDGCVVVEFDGLVKYAKADGKAALAAEKQRESTIFWLGYEVVRVIWSELANPAALVRRIREAKQRAKRRGLVPTR